MGLKPSEHRERIRKFEELHEKVATMDLSKLSGDAFVERQWAAFLDPRKAPPTHSIPHSIPGSIPQWTPHSTPHSIPRLTPPHRDPAAVSPPIPSIPHHQDPAPGTPPLYSIPQYQDPASVAGPAVCDSPRDSPGHDEDPKPHHHPATEADEAAVPDPTTPRETTTPARAAPGSDPPPSTASHATAGWKGMVLLCIGCLVALLWKSEPREIRFQSVVLASDDWLDLRRELFHRSQEIQQSPLPIAQDVSASLHHSMGRVSQTHTQLESLGLHLGANLTSTVKRAVQNGSIITFPLLIPVLQESQRRASQLAGSLDESTGSLHLTSGVIRMVQANLTREKQEYDSTYNLFRMGWEYFSGTRQTDQRRMDRTAEGIERLDRAHAARQELAPILTAMEETIQLGHRSTIEHQNRLTGLVAGLAFICQTIESQQLEFDGDPVMAELHQSYGRTMRQASGSPRAQERFETYWDRL